MSVDPYRQLKAIVLDVLELPPEDRDTALIAACHDHPELLDAARELLSYDDSSGSQPLDLRLPGNDLPTDQIGPYRLLKVLGEGGMGVVYLASQDHPVQRLVALKVIKRGMDTEGVVARFAAERQALAMMSHPSIAQIYDAGATPNGRPYFVMEFAPGSPLTEFCAEHRFDVRERLNLFLPVCHAVQHAHQKGIIHRDLKPSNILVTLQDGRPVPKVIDFGVAKATGQRAADHTLATALAGPIGTPTYMSPEQAAGGSSVDTTTDVYALGVILYELLTGRPPLTIKFDEIGNLADLSRIIAEHDPPRPSTRVQSTAAATTITHPGQSPGNLQRELRGELDWIVLRAMEKDPERRYASASEFANDIQRYLDNQPVLARPPSAAYQLRKIISRHRTPFAFLAALVVLLAVFGVVMSALYTRSTRAEKRALAAEAEARNEAAVAEVVSDYMVDVFKVANPGQTRGEEVTARELLESGFAKIEDGLAGQPVVQGRMLTSIGQAFQGLGLRQQMLEAYERALEIRREIYPEPHPELSESLNLYAIAVRANHQPETARELYEEALAMDTQLHDEPHPDVARDKSMLGTILAGLGRFDEAEVLQREAVSIYEDLPGDHLSEVVSALINWASTLRKLDRLDEAAAALRRSVDLERAVDGEDTPMLPTAFSNLAGVLKDLGRYEEAETMYRQIVAEHQVVFPTGHPEVPVGLNNLASVLRLQGKLAEAESLYHQAIAGFKQYLGDENLSVSFSLLGLGLTIMDQGDAERAEPYLVESLALRRRFLPGGHWRVDETKSVIGACLAAQGRHAAAEPLLLEALSGLQEKRGPKNKVTREARERVAVYYAAAGDRDLAEKYRRQEDTP